MGKKYILIYLKIYIYYAIVENKLMIELCSIGIEILPNA
jgi:hypothetical protein